MTKKAILCIDDENIILASLKSELIDLLNYDYSIELAETGTEAIELFRELIEEGYEIPLVISDYIMPGIKGDELLEIIHRISPDTVKIMLTGQAVIEGVTNAINNAELFKYIEKPWDKNFLFRAVEEAIDYYNKNKAIEEERKNLLVKRAYLEHELWQKICQQQEEKS